ncbi:SMI1/KNR4 family protein [Azospirillum sp. B2RO_4]|uniref:SMI1/KNR4 family protein n=1 Tax=Azospirillum sp. B2RO_4 TaxID=3027796 RepID=UPI003DA80228
MWFRIPPETLAYWRQTGMEPESDAAIAELEQQFGGKAPASYVDFMKTYGSVEFNFEINNGFDYIYEMEDRRELRTEAVSFIKSVEKALAHYESIQEDEQIDIPKYLLPIARDYGQGEILLEIARPTERVFYWRFQSHDWESGKTKIAFVADSFTDFINGLKKYE